MWITGYLSEIKRQFREVHHFAPRETFIRDELLVYGVPDGTYPMVILGKLDNVRVMAGQIDCCNFEEDRGRSVADSMTIQREIEDGIRAEGTLLCDDCKRGNHDACRKRWCECDCGTRFALYPSEGGDRR